MTQTQVPTQKKLILKGCGRCHGDLILDEVLDDHNHTLLYRCLQCGRPMRLIGIEAEQPKSPVAA